MLRIPEDSRAPRRAIVSAGNHENIGTFRLNLHLLNGNQIGMSLQTKLNSVNCQGLAAEFSKLHIAHRALATLLALVFRVHFLVLSWSNNCYLGFQSAVLVAIRAA
jgi:hypothetical protein